MSAQNLVRKLVSKLPQTIQRSLKRLKYANEIRSNRFYTDEPEFDLLDQWISEGDWVLDIGANIGHYTHRMSRLVGRSGRVLAFEPVPETFELLAFTVTSLPFSNVTLFNVAASDTVGITGMSIPKFDTGLDNLYMAHLTNTDADLQIMTLPIDNLALRKKVRLVKIDAEGHDLSVLRGMTALIDIHRPLLIIESDDEEISALLKGFGYTGNRLPNSSNVVFQPP